MTFKIDGIGLYKNRRGEKVEIKKKANNNPEMWVCRDALGYYADGTVTGFSDRLPEFDIISRWTEPLELVNLYPNCDNPTLRTGDEKKFYIVYSPDGLIRKATQHKNPWLARKEVDELVKYHSGSYKFYVMEAIACFEASVNVKEREVV